MKSTLKLYASDPYLQEADCTIIDSGISKNRTYVILDQTPFFPTGGGQPCDLGWIDDCQVLDVLERGDIVYHYVDKIPANTSVHCRIDWTRRMDHMQQHCGEHIVSGIFLREYGLHNLGFHLGEAYTTVDIDVPALDEEMIRHVELMANQAVQSNTDVITTIVHSQDEAHDHNVRKLSDIEGSIRVVQIQNTDSVACCGTHPHTTGEVGLIKIIRWQKYKSMTRVFLLCGQRALRDYQQKHAIISSLNQTYSSDTDHLIDRIIDQKEKLRQLTIDMKQMKIQISGIEAKQLLSNSLHDKLITATYSDKDMADLQSIAGQIVQESTAITAFLTNHSQHHCYAVLFSTDSLVDCGKVYRAALQSITGGKGGGNPQQAQARFDSQDALQQFIEQVKSILSI